MSLSSEPITVLKITDIKISDIQINFEPIFRSYHSSEYILRYVQSLAGLTTLGLSYSSGTGITTRYVPGVVKQRHRHGTTARFASNTDTQLHKRINLMISPSASLALLSRIGLVRRASEEEVTSMSFRLTLLDYLKESSNIHISGPKK